MYKKATQQKKTKQEFIPLSKEEFEKKYKQKADFLKEQILERGTGKAKFLVFNHEAGFGKSLITDEILQDEVKKWSGIESNEQKRFFLIVKRFRKDVLQSEKKISSNGKYKDQVLGITRDNWSVNEKWKFKDVSQFQVIIITHARYVALCTNEEEREALTKGRHTLIIDEKMEFPIFSFSKKEYQDLHEYVPVTKYQIILDTTKPLFEEMEIQKAKVTVNGRVRFNNEILTCFPKIGDMNLLNELSLAIQSNNKLKIDDKRKGEHIISSLRKIYSNQKCLYNGEKISTIDSSHRLFGLQNNIILDANGQIDKLYSEDIAWQFEPNIQMKIIYHHESKIQHIKFNSSKNSIGKHENEYFSKIIDQIKANQKEGDKTLIVLHKRFVLDDMSREGIFLNYLRKSGINDIFIGSEDGDGNNSYNNQSFAVNWFGNLIGKNDWRDFNKCWIIGTPILPMDTYILNLWQYTGNQAWKMGLQTISDRSGVYQFKNPVLEGIRKGYIIGEIYQAIKRIQRNHNPKGEFFIVNNDEKVFKQVTKQLPHIQVLESIDLDIVSVKVRARRENLQQQKSEKTNKIIELILSKEIGEYSKSEIESEAGISKGQLSRYFSKNVPDVIEYLGIDFVIENKVIRRI